MGECRLKIEFWNDHQNNNESKSDKEERKKDIDDGMICEVVRRVYSSDVTLAEVWNDLMMEGRYGFEDDELLSVWDITLYPPKNITQDVLLQEERKKKTSSGNNNDGVGDGIVQQKDQKQQKHRSAVSPSPSSSVYSKTLFTAGCFPSAVWRIQPRRCPTPQVARSISEDAQYNRKTMTMVTKTTTTTSTSSMIKEKNTADNSNTTIDTNRHGVVEFRDDSLNARSKPSDVFHRLIHENRSDVGNTCDEDALAVRRQQQFAARKRKMDRFEKLEARIRLLKQQQKQQEGVNGKSMKSKKPVEMVRNMLIKSRCEGSSSLKVQDRVYFCLWRLHDHGGGDEQLLEEEGVVEEEYRYFSRQDTIGRVLQGSGESELLVELSNGSYRRLPVMMRIYEAIDEGYLRPDVNSVVIRSLMGGEAATPSVMERTDNDGEDDRKHDRIEGGVLDSSTMDVAMESDPGGLEGSMAAITTSTSGVGATVSASAGVSGSSPTDDDDNDSDKEGEKKNGLSLDVHSQLTAALVEAEEYKNKTTTKKKKSSNGKSSKKGGASEKLRQMLMKSKSKGDKKRIPKMEERFFVEIITAVATSSSSSSSSSPSTSLDCVFESCEDVFMSKRDTLKRLLDDRVVLRGSGKRTQTTALSTTRGERRCFAVIAGDDIGKDPTFVAMNDESMILGDEENSTLQSFGKLIVLIDE